jgi:hypothetical protein
MWLELTFQFCRQQNRARQEEATLRERRAAARAALTPQPTGSVPETNLIDARLQRLKLEGTPRIKRERRHPAPPPEAIPATADLTDFMVPKDVSDVADFGSLAQQMMANICDTPGTGGVADILGSGDALSPTSIESKDPLLSPRRQRRQREPFNPAKDMKDVGTNFGSLSSLASLGSLGSFPSFPSLVELPPSPATPGTLIESTVVEDTEAATGSEAAAGSEAEAEEAEALPEADNEAVAARRSSLQSRKSMQSNASSRRTSAASSRRNRHSMARSASEQSNTNALSRKTTRESRGSIASRHSSQSLQSLGESPSAEDLASMGVPAHERSPSFVSATSQVEDTRDSFPIPAEYDNDDDDAERPALAPGLLSPPSAALIPPSDEEDEGDATIVLPKAPVIDADVDE